jgi:flavin reductase (DIM6/NTAB) family NADH-FMN oxidoreductase RutF
LDAINLLKAITSINTEGVLMMQVESLAHVDASRYRDAMRRVPAAVTIVTARFEREANGLTATAVCSVTADPPQVLVCVNRGATAESLIAKSRRFVVNFLSEEHEDRARRFSQAKLSGHARFEGISWIEMSTGSPAMTDAIVALDCTVNTDLICGTHAIYLANVVDVRVGEASPLLYRAGEFCRLRRQGEPS